jgi:hypothetical protein
MGQDGERRVQVADDVVDGGVAGYRPAMLPGDGGDVPVNGGNGRRGPLQGQALDEQLQLLGELPGAPVGPLAPGQAGQAVSAVTGRPPLQRPVGDSAMSGQPGERHAIFDVRAQDLPAGHRLVPLSLGQIGQVPRIGAGHLSSVTPRPSRVPRYRRIRHPSGLPAP